jgi:hypothetical protein
MTMWDQITDDARQAIVIDMIASFPGSGIPDHLRDGLLRYFADGILPGSFLQAVLCNDLQQAIRRAAPGAILAIPELLTFLTAHAPAGSWGSREAVLAWTTTPQRLEV